MVWFFHFDEVEFRVRSESSVFLSRVESGYTISVEVRVFGVQYAVNERLVQLEFLHGKYYGFMGAVFSVCQKLWAALITNAYRLILIDWFSRTFGS